MRVRKAIVEAQAQGLTYLEIQAKVRVSHATVTRVLRRKRERGNVEPLERGGGNFSPLQGAFEKRLRALVAKMPDATVAELTEALVGETNVSTSKSSVQRALARFGYTRKKSASWQLNETR